MDAVHTGDDTRQARLAKDLLGSINISTRLEANSACPSDLVSVVVVHKPAHKLMGKVAQRLLANV